MIWIDKFRKFKKDGHYGFNIYDDERKLFINGYRIVNNRLCPPSIMYGKGKYFPAVLVDEKTAKGIYAAVICEKELNSSHLSESINDIIKDIIVTEDRAKIYCPNLEIY